MLRLSTSPSRFDDAHANHLHVDIGRFGPEQPRLTRRSRAQVQALQAVCRHVWGVPRSRSPATTTAQARDATTRVLAQVGGPGELDDSREASQAFLVATVQHA